jgi:hypothetical protein
MILTANYSSPHVDAQCDSSTTQIPQLPGMGVKMLPMQAAYVDWQVTPLSGASARRYFQSRHFFTLFTLIQPGRTPADVLAIYRRWVVPVAGSVI